MLYAIIAEDVADSLGQRSATRPAHLARLEALQAEGRLVLVCPSRRRERGQGGEARKDPNAAAHSEPSSTAVAPGARLR